MLAAAGISFSVHALNLLAIFAALATTATLVLLLFGLRQKWIGLPAGCLGTLCWGLVVVYLLGAALFDGNSEVMVMLDNGIVCRETVYGFVTSDSGEELEIFRRFYLVDYRLHHQIHSEVYPNATQTVPTEIGALVLRCQHEIDLRRSHPDGERSPVIKG